MRVHDESWNRTQRQRLGRRTLIRAGVVAGTGALLADCSGDRDRQPGAAQPTASRTAAPVTEGLPRPGGQLREATIVQAPHFSPFHSGAEVSYVNTFRRAYGYYDYLWGFKSVTAPDRLHLMLAQSFEQPDPTTVIVRLKPATFHHRAPAHGRPVTAEDIAAMLTFLRAPPANGGSFLQSGRDLKAVAALDPSTVRFEMLGPRAFFFEGVGGATKVIPPREMLDEQTLKRSVPVGSGPYEYKTHTQGSIEEMKRFDGYRVQEQPYITERKLINLPDNAAIEAAFRANQIDWMTFTNVRQKDAVAKDLGSTIVLTEQPAASGSALVLNIHRPPWNDIRAREAVYRAIDVDRILTVIFFGEAERTWYFARGRTTRNPLGPEAVKPYIASDPRRAAALFKAVGIDATKEYELIAPSEFPQMVDTARLIAEDLGTVGLKVRVNPVVRNLYLQRGGPKPGDFDLAMSTLLDYNNAQTNSGATWNSTSLEDPEVDAIVEQIQQTVDTVVRDTLSQEFERMLARKYSNLIPLLSEVEHHAWYRALQGIDPEFHPINGIQARRWLDR